MTTVGACRCGGGRLIEADRASGFRATRLIGARGASIVTGGNTCSPFSAYATPIGTDSAT
jgi:hypothetical protein